MGIKTDIVTGRTYVNNIPVGKINSVVKDGVKYEILPLHIGNEAWYNGRFIGTDYAVFKQKKGYKEQVSIWYHRYGNAIRTMLKKLENDV